MINKINNNLNTKKSGFSGITHILIAITLTLVMIRFPFKLTQDFVSFITSNWILIISSFLIIIGASLLPDLDNDISTATVQLGIIGALIKTSMQTISYIVYAFTRLRNDDKAPQSMHRKLFHTPFVAFLLIALFYFGLEIESNSFLNIVRDISLNKNWSEILSYPVTSICILLIFISTWLGINTIMYWPLKIVRISLLVKNKQILFILIAMAITYYSMTLPMTQLRYMGIAIGVGYLFHIIGDLFSEGSVPIIWPIPALWAKKFWYAPNILGPFQIYTGGIVNKIINIGLLVLNSMLIISFLGF